MFVFLSKYSWVSVSFGLFYCLLLLFGSCPAPVNISGKCLYCCCKFDFVTQSSFSSIITHLVLFHIFIHPLGRIRYIEFELHGLRLPVHFMGKPSNVSTHYFVFFCFAKCNLLFLSVLTILSDHQWCWHLLSSFIWYHLIMMARGQGGKGCRPYL